MRIGIRGEDVLATGSINFAVLEAVRQSVHQAVQAGTPIPAGSLTPAGSSSGEPAGAPAPSSPSGKPGKPDKTPPVGGPPGAGRWWDNTGTSGGSASDKAAAEIAEHIAAMSEDELIEILRALGLPTNVSRDQLANEVLAHTNFAQLAESMQQTRRAAPELKGLHRMTLPELKDFAQRWGLDLGKAKTKQEIVDVIEASHLAIPADAIKEQILAFFQKK